MLTCVYHPLDAMRVVESEEADRLKATGVWFDCPKKAKNYREKIESDIKDESRPEEIRPRKHKRGT